MARLCSLETPLGDALKFSRMSVSEQLSGLLTMQIEALAAQPDVSPAALLGQPVTVTVDYGEGAKRYFNGMVSRMSVGGTIGRHYVYHLTVRPWLWLLTRTVDCRIFQNETVPDIVKKLLGTMGVGDFELRLSDHNRYKPWEYCVQYRETDFNFVARLLEQEGIYWFFEHAPGAHKLVLTDNKGKHLAVEGETSIRFIPGRIQQVYRHDLISDWDESSEIQPGQFVTRDYDFKRPRDELEVVRMPENPPEHAMSKLEVYDWPGDYDSHAEGEAYVESRIEELHAQHTIYSGRGSLRFFEAGRKFMLSDHPRADQNGEYLITSVQHDYHDPPQESRGEEGSSFSCRFTAIPAKQQFRAPRNTPRPIVQGIQTAVIVGPPGDEIFTDEYGRVKVQFHWDREGRNDQESSCWLRVAFPAAGERFGFVAIPRIGQEAVVSFLEGDPDRPLITGMVYNADNMPPWKLPDNMTQSGMLTRSSLRGSYDNANALRFEDKKGSEQVWLHAEKNQDIEVEHDETHWVGNDREKTIDRDEREHVKRDRFETIDRHRTIRVGADHSEQIGGAMSIIVAKTLDETVAINYTETVGGAMQLSVGAAMAVTVGGAYAETVGATKVETIGGSKSEQVGTNRAMSVGNNVTDSIGGERSGAIGKSDSLRVGKQQTVQVGEGYSLTAKKVQITADDEIVLKTGSAEIVLKKNGDITIKGKNVSVSGSGKVDVKASGDVKIKGSKVGLN